MVYEPINTLVRFTSVPDSVHLAKDIRAFGSAAKCTTGVRFLDKALCGGVGVSDVLLIAAPPGAGKTELSVKIATHNAMSGKRVHFFALEAEPHEITQRLQYRELADLFFKSTVYRKEMVGRTLNFCDWMDGKYADILKDLESQVEEIIREKFKMLSVYYREKDFGIEELTRQVLAVKDQTDLVILDHIHYVDLPEGESENRAMSDLVKAIRDIALISQKPIIVVAHIRKRNSFVKTLLPELDDIHGTSNLGKVATKALVIAPCFDQETGRPNEFFTYMRVVKNRRDQSRCRYTALCVFDSVQNCYKNEFIPGRLKKGGSEWEEIAQSDYPYWLKEG